MSKHEFQLLFTQESCGGCGTEHAVGVPCEQCGAEAKPDPYVEARREIVQEAQDLLHGGEVEGVDRGLDPGLFDRMATWLGEILDTCARVADEDPAAGAALADLVRQLVQWEADLAAAQRLRPFLWYWDVLALCHGQFREVATRYLAALAAADPETAQREAQAAQEAFDAATAAATELEHRLARWNKVEDAGTEHEPTAVLAALFDAAAQERSGLSLLGPDPYADQLYERVTGARGCPITLALGLRATAIQVDMIVDEDRFWECAARTYRRLTTTESDGQAAFDRLAAQQPWRSDLAEMQAELFEAGFELRQTMVIDRQRTQARGLIRFGHVLAERCAPTLIATLLAAYRDRDYEPLPGRVPAAGGKIHVT